MASNRIKGITIEIGGDTTKLQTALKGVNSSIKATQTSLRDVNNLLKLDPTNTQLLKQKQDLLKQSVADTEAKLKTEKEALAQLKKASPDEVTDEMKALEREVVSTEKYLESAKKELKDFGSVGTQKIKAVATKMKDFGTKAEAVGTTLTTKVTVPLVALGGAAVAAFNDVDEGVDTIVEKTGASGEALNSMTESMNNLATTIPTDFATAGNAIGEVNTRFGLTGSALESLSGQFVKFAQLNNTDVSTSVDNVQKVMKAFNVPTKNASLLLDNLNSVGQSTGVSMDTLSTSLVTNAAALQGMGMDAYSAAAFIGQLETSGVDTTVALAGMKKATATAASQGKTMGEAMSELSTKIKGAKSETEAINIASEYFGTKAGASIGSAAYNGSLSLDALAVSAQNASGSVSETFEGTLDPIDQWQLTLNQLKTTLATVGNSLMTVLAPALAKVSEVLKSLSEKFQSLSPEQQDMVVKIGLVVAAIGPLIAIVAKVISFISTIISLAPVIGAAITALTGPIGAVILIVTGLVACGVALYKNWDVIKAKAKELGKNISEKWNAMKKSVSDAANAIGAKAKEKFDSAKQSITTAMSTAKTNLVSSVTGMKNSATEKFNSIKSNISSKINSAKESVSSAVTTMASKAGSKFSEIKDSATNKFKEARDNVSEKMNDMKNKVKEKAKDVATNLKDGIKGLPGEMLSIGGDIVAGIWNGINNKVDWIKKKLLGFKDSVLDALKDAFDINSPSKVMRDEVGKFLPMGVAEGIDKNTKYAIKSAQQMSDAVVGASTLTSGSVGTTTSSSTTNVGGVNMTIYGAQGQNVNELADIIESRLNSSISRREAVFA